MLVKCLKQILQNKLFYLTKNKSLRGRFYVQGKTKTESQEKTRESVEENEQKEGQGAQTLSCCINLEEKTDRVAY